MIFSLSGESDVIRVQTFPQCVARSTWLRGEAKKEAVGINQRLSVEIAIWKGLYALADRSYGQF